MNDAITAIDMQITWKGTLKIKTKDGKEVAVDTAPRDSTNAKLIEVARTNRNPEVRKQAMFWLGQSKDPRAVEFFEQILTAK